MKMQFEFTFSRKMKDVFKSLLGKGKLKKANVLPRWRDRRSKLEKTRPKPPRKTSEDKRKALRHNLSERGTTFVLDTGDLAQEWTCAYVCSTARG